MVRCLILFLALLSEGSLLAQYDIGGMIGLHRRELRGRDTDAHAWANFSAIARPDWNVGLFYREKHGSHTNLGLELTWMRHEFHAGYHQGGLAGGTSNDVHVVLHTLNFAVLPEVRLGTGSEAVVRFGVSCGFRVAGRKNGTRYEQWPYHADKETFTDAVPDDFGGELRAIFGFGFRVPTGPRGGITIDPYLARGFSSMLKAEPGSVSTEIGFRLGWAFRVKKEGLSRWIDRRAPTPPAGPTW